MKVLNQELFTPQQKQDLTVYIVTTNAFLRKDGGVVMGRGAAIQATRLIPGIDLEAGALIAQVPRLLTGYAKYGFMIVRPGGDGRAGFGIFQVKYYFGNNAQLDLIEHSAGKLAEIANANPNKQYRLNFPGIGNGKLREVEVLPLLQQLPDNVVVCKLPKRRA